MSKRILAVLLLTAGTAAAAQEWSEAVLEGDPARGQQLAAAGTLNVQACQACHGLDGKGDPANGVPRIAGQPAFYLAKQLGDFAADRRQNQIMGPIAKGLKPGQARDLAAWYAQQPPRATSAPEPVDQRQLARGKAIVEKGVADDPIQGCANCHGPEARGLPPNGPSLAGQHPGYLKRQIGQWRAGTRTNDAAGQMRGIAEKLNDADAEAVANYLATVQP